MFFSVAVFAEEKTVTYSEIRDLKRGIVPHIVSYCRGQDGDYSACVKKELLSFSRSLKLSEIEKGDYFARLCIDDYIKMPLTTKGSVNLEGFRTCAANFIWGLQKSTPVPEMNYIFLKPDADKYLSFSFCNDAHFLNSAKTNACLSTHRRDAKQFIVEFFSQENARSQSVIAQCLARQQKLYFEKQYFNFEKLNGCLDVF
jgi:hypothetical protein